MITLHPLKLIPLALCCAALTTTPLSARAGVVKGHAGTTFELLPIAVDGTGRPTLYTHTVDGVVRIFELGNCTFHADVIVSQPNANDPFTLKGTFQITTARGDTVLYAEVQGIGTPDPANPSVFLNFHYDVKFTGGTGSMANARGTADIDGFGIFTSRSTGKATWLIQGNLATQGRSQ